MAQRRQRAQSPLAPGASVGRVDQGVDYSQSSPYRAIGSGRIYAIDPNFYKGTPAVYEQLDQPVTVNGRTYGQVYYSETPSLVRQGDRVAAGQPVTAGGSAELGFARGALPAAHYTYSEGVPQPQGYDFRSLVSGQAPSAAAPVTAALSGVPVPMPNVPANPQVQAPMSAVPAAAGPRPLPAAVRAAIQILRA